MINEQIASEVQQKQEVNNQPTSQQPDLTNNQTTEKPVEKMLKQSEVNEIVGRAKKEAAEKALRESEHMRNMQQQQSQSNSVQQSIGGMPNLDINQVRQAVNQLAQEQYDYNVGSNFLRKVEDFKNKNPEFAKNFDDLDIGSLPLPVVHVFNSFDNITDILNHVVNTSPKDYLQLVASAAATPKLAMRELQKLSESIKANQAALQTKIPSAPLSQVSPSTTGTDNGKLKVSDLRKLNSYKV